jgi:hypothetical protein
MQCLAHPRSHVRTPETQEIKPQTVGMDENQYLGPSLVLHCMKMWMEIAQWCLLSIPPTAIVMMSMTRMWLKGSRCHHMSLLQARLRPTMYHVSLLCHRTEPAAANVEHTADAPLVSAAPVRSESVGVVLHHYEPGAAFVTKGDKDCPIEGTQPSHCWVEGNVFAVVGEDAPKSSADIANFSDLGAAWYDSYARKLSNMRDKFILLCKKQMCLPMLMRSIPNLASVIGMVPMVPLWSVKHACVPVEISSTQV